MRESAYALVLLLLFASATGFAVDVGDVVLKTNPFAAPVNAQTVAGANRAAPAQPETAMELYGTLAAGQASMADIGGEVLGLGEEVNGYELVEVHDLHIVLRRGAEHVTMWIDGYGEPESDTDLDTFGGESDE